MNDGEHIKVNTDGKWTISLEDLTKRGETPDGKSLVEILPEGEMNMYDKLRQEMLQMFQDRAENNDMDTMEEANDLEFDDDDENLIDTPYEYKAMTDEYLAEQVFRNANDVEKEVIEEKVEEKEEKQEDIAT